MILRYTDLFSSTDSIAVVECDSLYTVWEVELTTRARWELWLAASAGHTNIFSQNIFIANQDLAQAGDSMESERQVETKERRRRLNMMSFIVT